jgi:hypothetical protein
MTLTKREIAAQITKETGIIRTQVLDVMQRTLDQITARGGCANRRPQRREIQSWQGNARRGNQAVAESNCPP